ncbi:MAG: hypothetical protein ABFR33_07890 [Verrucomicrobiota bacterium]
MRRTIIIMALLAGITAYASKLDFADGTLGAWKSNNPQVWNVVANNAGVMAAASLGMGEEGTGMLKSPVFTIASSRQLFQIAGADGTAEGTNDGQKNFVYLKSSPDGEILRTMRPTGTHIYSEVGWDTADLLGRKVYLEVVDGNPGLNPRGFAWIGIAGYRQDAACSVENGVLRNDLYGLRIDSGSEAVLCRSMPFYTRMKVASPPFANVSLANEGQSQRRIEGNEETIPVGTSAKTLYLLGMINGWDYGVAHWGEHPEFWDKRDDQIFVGSEIGRIEIRYADGESDFVPLKIGATSWFVQAWAYAPLHGWTNPVQEPFASRPRFKKVLDAALKLKEQPSAATNDSTHRHFYLAVAPRNKEIESIVIHNNAEVRGRPLVSAVTLANPSQTKNLESFGKRFVSRSDLESQFNTFEQNDFSKELKRLARVLYTTEADLPEKVGLIDFPSEVKGATIRFKGDKFSDMLSNIWVANLTTMAGKFKSETGIFWESTPKYPWYGGYNGIGTWAPAGIYYPGVFPRCSDHYASLPLRLVDDLERNQNWFDFVDGGLYFYRDNHDPKKGPPNAHMNVDKYPPGELGHWAFTLPPSGGPHQINEIWGDEEMDGHGATAVVRWQVWRQLGMPAGDWLMQPREDVYGHSRWDTTRDAAEFICWLMDYTGMDVIYSEGESTGWGAPRGKDLFNAVPDGMMDETDMVKIRKNYANSDMYHPYPTYTCMQALECCADMADAAGQEEMAAKWRDYAERIRVAMIRLMARGENSQRKWLQSRHSVLPSMQDSLVTAWFSIYREGLDPKTFDPEIRRISQNTLDDQLGQNFGHKPVLGMGYGIGWLTHAALTLDAMDDADKLLENMARYTYDKNMNYVDKSRGIDWRHYQWVVPEGSNILPDGSWYRIGDLGNGANQGPCLHALETCAGVDDTNPGNVKILPRVGASMSGIEVEDFPVLIPEGDGLARTKINYEYDRETCRFSLKSEEAIPSLNVRLGPCSQAKAQELSASLKSSAGGSIRIETSGTYNGDAAWWIWVEGMTDVETLTIK